MARDYYQLLGLPKTATEKDIRSAFRRLARKYHPDVNPHDKAAEAKFKEINEAHEVLSDPEKRKKYDRYGADWKHAEQYAQAAAADPFGGAARRPYASRSTPHGVHVDIGGDDGVGVGVGFESIFDSLFGRSRGPQSASRPAGLEHPIEITLEEAYNGATRILQMQDPGGSTRRLEVKIPVGAKTGSRIRMAGAGDAGPRGGPASDIYLVVKVLPHPQFIVEGEDLHTEVTVPLTTAILGGEVEVPTLRGSKVALKIPPETQNGKLFRLAGLGMPKLNSAEKGDLYAKVKVVLPTGLTEPERQLFRGLQQAGR